VSFDPYRILGLDRDATEEQIRQGYRALARRFHPDLNKSPDAEERFKELGQALAVLTDARRRELFDRFGEASLQVGFEPDRTRGPRPGPDPGPRRRRPAPSRPEPRPAPGEGLDVTAPLEIDLLTAIVGGEVRATSPLTGAPLMVMVPAGTEDGDQVCLQGRGRPGRGGAPGDLCFELRIKPHPFFHREDRDLVLELPLTIDEAFHGTPVQIPTLEGWVRLRVPPGSRGGERLRLRGKGLVDRSGRRGDLHVHLCIRLPDRLDALGRALDRVSALYTTPVRQGLKL
jgi:DnaJ-class molecular chaperone